MRRLVAVLPQGWQFPSDCMARVVLEDRTYSSPGFSVSPWTLSAPVVFEGEPVGEVAVCEYDETENPWGYFVVQRVQ